LEFLFIYVFDCTYKHWSVYLNVWTHAHLYCTAVATDIYGWA